MRTSRCSSWASSRVLTALGIGSTSGNVLARDLPLIIVFAVVSDYTHLAGLRAPALIAFVKDILIYLTVIVAIGQFAGQAPASVTNRPRRARTVSGNRGAPPVLRGARSLTRAP